METLLQKWRMPRKTKKRYIRLHGRDEFRVFRTIGMMEIHSRKIRELRAHILKATVETVNVLWNSWHKTMRPVPNYVHGGIVPAGDSFENRMVIIGEHGKEVVEIIIK